MSGRLAVAEAIIDWEGGSLNWEGEVELFQNLVDCGLAWQLQGAYGRRAAQLIDEGWVWLGIDHQLTVAALNAAGTRLVGWLSTW